MTNGRRILWLILIMMAAVTVSTAVAITVLYRTAFERERAHLIQTVEDQAHIMDAVARFDQQHSDGESGASETATPNQASRTRPHTGRMHHGSFRQAQEQTASRIANAGLPR